MEPISSESRHEQFVGRVVAGLGSRSPSQRASENYWLSKEIDGHHEGTGTFPLFSRRVDKLHRLTAANGAYYEPLGSYDELFTLSGVSDLLVKGNAPTWALNDLFVSVRIFESAYGAPLGILPLPELEESEQGVHQVWLSGSSIRGGGLRFTNWWGGEWGYGGRGVLSREYIERYMVEAWLSRPTGVGPTRFALPLLQLNAANPAVFTAAWVPTLPGLGEVSFAALEHRTRHDGADYLIRTHETLSASRDPVEMIELYGPSGVPLGWAHLRHLIESEPRISVCEEFLV